MAWRAAAIALLLWSVPATASAATTADATFAVTKEIEAILARDPVVIAGAPVRWDLRRLYAPFGYAPLWHPDDGRRKQRQMLTEILRMATEHGLAKKDTPLPTPSGSQTARSIAEADLLLSEQFLRYSVELRHGSVTAVSGDRWEIPADPFDPIDALVDALRTETLAQHVASLPPPDRGYSRLLEALRRHRQIVAEGDWPLVSGTTEVRLDGSDARLPLLRARLRAEGDLEAMEGVEAPEVLLAAIGRFQRRHGLDPDGRVGPRTLRELGVTARQRSAQIAANLERWRWLPRDRGDTYIVVNVAAATLALIRDGNQDLVKRVVVGDEKHPTPAFAATITAITLNPSWNVPISIAVREILPKLKRDPHYLAANDIVILGRPDDPSGRTVDWRSISSIAFPFRLQQQPGFRNALGLIKFEMENRFGVYLHDTPDKRFFARSRRALSHGCIRIEKPLDLAAALIDSPIWGADTLEAAIAEERTQRIPLLRPTAVYLLYFTAFIDEAGQVNFRRDVYDRDSRIERAIDAERRSGLGAGLIAGGCPEPGQLGEHAEAR